MPNDPLGSWRHPPLAYVVAELAISPHYSLKGAVPQLQDALRTNFPRTIEGTELVIDPTSPPAAQPLWRLLSADQTQGVHISSRSLSMHATAYTNSVDFLQRWEKTLLAIEAAKLGAFVERAGLRYLDLIVPSQGHEPKDYLISSLHGVGPPIEGVVQNSMWGTAILIDGFLVQARIAAPSPQGMLLGPNFNPLPLQKPPVWIEAERCIETKQPIGFIDTECGRDVQKIFDAKELLALSSRLHDRVSEMFKSLLSGHAKSEWI